MIKLELYPDVKTTAQDLMDHEVPTKDLKLRVLNILSGTSLLGIIMQETEDSFLVGLPCKLMEYENKKAVQPYIPIPFIRVFKTTIIVALPCFGEFEIFYIKWLLDHGKYLYPDLVCPAYEDKLKERLSDLKSTAEELKRELESLAGPKIEEEPIASMIAPPSKLKH